MLDAVARQYPLWIESAWRVTLPPSLVEWSIASVHIGARDPSTRMHPSHLVSHPWQTTANGSSDCQITDIEVKIQIRRSLREFTITSVTATVPPVALGLRRP